MPLWNIDDSDDATLCCDNCGRPLNRANATLCRRCQVIADYVAAEFGVDEAPETLRVEPPFRDNLLRKAHDILGDD